MKSSTDLFITGDKVRITSGELLGLTGAICGFSASGQPILHIDGCDEVSVIVSSEVLELDTAKPLLVELKAIHAIANQTRQRLLKSLNALECKLRAVPAAISWGGRSGRQNGLC